jgi:hypothetical protein
MFAQVMRHDLRGDFQAAAFCADQNLKGFSFVKIRLPPSRSSFLTSLPLLVAGSCGSALFTPLPLSIAELIVKSYLRSRRKPIKYQAKFESLPVQIAI